MQQVEVQIVQTQVGKSLLASGLNIIRVMLGVPELAGDENLFPVEKVTHYVSIYIKL
jgi:hypothetical protein